MIASNKKRFIKGYNEILDRERVKNGLSLRALAKKAKFSYQAVRNTLNGDGGILCVIGICNALNFKVTKILKGE